MLRFLVLAMAATLSLTAAQPKVAISAVTPHLDFGPACAVTFGQIVIAIDNANLPPISDLEVLSLWRIVAVFQDATGISARPLSVIRVEALTLNGLNQYAITGQVVLTLDSPVSQLPTELFVSLNLLTGAVKNWQPTDVTKKFVEKCTPSGPTVEVGNMPSTPVPSPGRTSGPCIYSDLGFRKAKEGEENVKLTGAYTAGFSAKPLYSVDATMEFPICPTQNYDISVGGTIKTAEQRSLDPDSFTSYISLRPKSASRYSQSVTWYRTWELKGGAEFSRKDQFENIVFAPKFVTGYSNFRVNSAGRLRYSGGLELTVSMELGDNRRTNAFRAGYGFIGRVAPAAQAYFLVPLRSPSRSFVINSTYNPRILLSAEPFTDNRILIVSNTPYKSFAKGTRHYLLNEVAVDLTDLASLSIKNEFGALPPAFKIVDFRFTIGLTLKWKWRE